MNRWGKVVLVLNLLLSTMEPLLVAGMGRSRLRRILLGALASIHPTRHLILYPIRQAVLLTTIEAWCVVQVYDSDG